MTVPTSEIAFVRFVETNDNEGENWTWWLQRDGNEDQLGQLHELLTDADVDEEYELRLDITEIEPVVDKLVEHADVGYYSDHNKVLGHLACPDSLGEYAGVLYKGGIRNLFSTSTVQS